MSKHTPANPASLMASSSGPPSTKPLSASTFQATSLRPPPSARNCAPRCLPDSTENDSPLSAPVRHDLQRLVKSCITSCSACTVDLPSLS
eukprot:scaffold14619_cov66-Phaeocystis_antarctica.AAC.6